MVNLYVYTDLSIVELFTRTLFFAFHGVETLLLENRDIMDGSTLSVQIIRIGSCEFK